jgi:L,D-transpeptidase ErfK/SrfK
MRSLLAFAYVSALALRGFSAFAGTPPAIAGETRTHVAARGETWRSLGARAGVTPGVLARRNGRSLDSPLRDGEMMVIDNRHIVPGARDASLVVNLPQRMLFHFRDGTLRGQYPVAVGRRTWQTPPGDFSIRAMEEDPTWDVPPSIQEEMRREGRRVLTKVPPGSDNPLGRHWLGLSLPNIGLHGTNAPLSIYSATTHGCMRMHPDDIAAVYAQVTIGDRGRTIYEPVLAAVVDDRVFLEVHPDIYGLVPDAFDLALERLDRAGAGRRFDPARVRRAVAEREGLAVDVTLDSTVR